MKIARSVALILLLTISLTALYSCASNKYNAVLYDDRFGQTRKWMDEDFLVKNRVFGYYQDESGEYVKFDDRKEPIFHILTDEASYNEVFTSCPLDIDFNTQMVIIYIFSAINNRNYYLKSIACEGSVLHAEIREYNSTKYDTSAPSQRCFVIVMDKAEITEVEVNTELSIFRFQEVNDAFEKK